MDISGIIEYERLFTLDLLHPVTEKPLGIKFQIRSAGSKEAKDVLRRLTDENTERLQKRKIIKGATLERQELEKAASYIASWDWGDNTWRGKKMDLTPSLVLELLEAEGWIFDAVTEAAGTVANFTQNSKKPSAKQ
jgi:hypothetical protein